MIKCTKVDVKRRLVRPDAQPGNQGENLVQRMFSRCWQLRFWHEPGTQSLWEGWENIQTNITIDRHQTGLKWNKFTLNGTRWYRIFIIFISSEGKVGYSYLPMPPYRPCHVMTLRSLAHQDERKASEGDRWRVAQGKDGYSYLPVPCPPPPPVACNTSIIGGRGWLENDGGEAWILFLTLVNYPEPVFHIIPLRSLVHQDETVCSGHIPHRGRQ